MQGQNMKFVIRTLGIALLNFVCWSVVASAQAPFTAGTWSKITKVPPAGVGHIQLLTDGSVLAQGYAPTKHTVKLTVRTDVPNITAFRLELLNDPNLPLGGPGRHRGPVARKQMALQVLEKARFAEENGSRRE